MATVSAVFAREPRGRLPEDRTVSAASCRRGATSVCSSAALSDAGVHEAGGGAGGCELGRGVWCECEAGGVSAGRSGVRLVSRCAGWRWRWEGRNTWKSTGDSEAGGGGLSGQGSQGRRMAP